MRIPGKGENQTMPAEGLFKNRLLAETAVVALNAKGTRGSAVYVIEKDDVKDVVADGEDDSLISREEVVDSEEGA